MFTSASPSCTQWRCAWPGLSIKDDKIERVAKLGQRSASTRVNLKIKSPFDAFSQMKVLAIQ